MGIFTRTTKIKKSMQQENQENSILACHYESLKLAENKTKLKQNYGKSCVNFYMNPSDKLKTNNY